MGYATDVPELDDDLAAGRMNGIGDLAPGGYLFRRMDARGIEVTLSHRADLAGFGDDQPGTGPLTVVLDSHRSRQMALDCPIAGQRCHDDAVGQGNFANFDWIKQRTHDDSPWWLLLGKKLDRSSILQGQK